jgi:hypothetical protein
MISTERDLEDVCAYCGVELRERIHVPTVDGDICTDCADPDDA